jgi:hypothetical protein
MYNTLFLVQILQSLGDLDNDVSRELFAKVGETDDLVEQLATGCQLENNVVVWLCLGKLDEFYNVGMVQLAHNLHLFEDIRSLWEAKRTRSATLGDKEKWTSFVQKWKINKRFKR